MSPDDFHFAQDLENEGWEYIYISDDGKMVFTRFAYGKTYSLSVGIDR